MPRQISCQEARKPDSEPGMITGVSSATRKSSRTYRESGTIQVGVVVFSPFQGSWCLVDKQFGYSWQSISYYAACPLDGWGPPNYFRFADQPGVIAIEPD